jgi:hypothetical protein
LKKLTLACALSAAAALLAAANASAAGVPLTPAPNETVTSPEPTLSWTVPHGESVSDILIAQSDKHNHSGVLTEAMDDGQVTGKRSYHYTASILTPGDYYWQLSGLDATGNPAVSAIRHFVVPPIIEVSPVKARWAPYFDNGRPVDNFVATIRCNLVQRPEISLKVFQGRKVLRTESFSAGWCVDMKPYAFSDTYQKPQAMPRGTRLTAQFFIKYGSFTAESALTPFSAH